MQNNSFFGTVLRSLGFQVTSVGARVSTDFTSETPRYTGWSHQVNLVTIGDSKFLVDVGFGSDGPTFAVPLVEGYTRYLTGREDQPVTSACLTREGINQTGTNTRTYTDTSVDTAAAKDPSQQLWIYKVRYDHQGVETSRFKPKYCFTELEFLPQDFAVMNHYVSTSRTSMFVNTLLCMKLLPDEKYSEIIGDITLWGSEIKEREWGLSRSMMEIKSERDRVEALEKCMGVKLLDEEVNGIRGLPTEIQE